MDLTNSVTDRDDYGASNHEITLKKEVVAAKRQDNGREVKEIKAE